MNAWNVCLTRILAEVIIFPSLMCVHISNEKGKDESIIADEANKKKPQSHLICILSLSYPLSSQAILCLAKQLSVPRSWSLPCVNLKAINRCSQSI